LSDDNDTGDPYADSSNKTNRDNHDSNQTNMNADAPGDNYRLNNQPDFRTLSDKDEQSQGQPDDKSSALRVSDEEILAQLADDINPVIAMSEHTRVVLSGFAMSEIMNAGGSLTITNGISSLVLSAANIAELSLNPGDEVVIDFYLVTDPIAIDQPDESNEELLQNFYYLSILINGVKIESFITPLTLQFDLSGFRLNSTQRTKTTGLRYLGEDFYNPDAWAGHPQSGRSAQLGGRFIDRNIFEFKTSKLSIYGVIVSETLINIVTTIDKHEYTVNGAEKQTDTAPMIMEDRTMVPIRFIAEAFGADVEWINETKSVVITLDDKVLHMTIGEKLPGMDIAPIIHNDRTMVPLRYISEHFDANVIWDAETRSIYLYR
jgi:hypothetical protein